MIKTSLDVKGIEGWEIEAHKLANEMEEYAKNYRCKKCSEEYCNHMLDARAKKFKARIDGSVSQLIDTHIERSVD